MKPPPLLFEIHGMDCAEEVAALTVPDRVAPGGCPPGAPTDPNVRN
jgi:hypothetical protein